MELIRKDAIIIGGGPGGLAAAAELKKQGINDILILEREKQLGGILRQCIHDGFGLTRFGETLSGPEYAQRFIDEIKKEQIPYQTDCTVLEITNDKIVTAVCEGRIVQYQAKAVILSMGCRERTRGALGIPGSRPAGVYTAGVAQAYINLKNTMVGRKVIILGSGDIGMIMARRMTLEGAEVKAVFEVQPYPSGLPRNIEQCLNDYNIPLYLSHTVTKIHGESRLEGVTISQVNDRMEPVPGTEQYFECDTLILSVGLIPENELSLGAGVKLDPRTKGAYVDEFYQTSVPGIFAAGNVLHVHDLVDFVSIEAEKLADCAARYIENGGLPECKIQVETDDKIGHVIPQSISGETDINLSFRVRYPLKNVTLTVFKGEQAVAKKKYKKMLPAEMEWIKLKKEDLLPEGSMKVVISNG